MVPRPVRDPSGQTRIPALHGFSGNGTSANWIEHAVRRHGSARAPTRTMHFNSDPGFQSSFSGFEHQHHGRAGGAHARRLVEHRGTAARHPAASVVRAGGRRTEAQLHHRARHRAGHETADSGSVRRREDRAVALSRRQSGLAEPVAAGEPFHLVDRELVDAAGGGRGHHRIQGLGHACAG